MNKAKHFIIVTVLVIISTLFLRWILKWLFALPLAASLQSGPIDQMFSAHFWMISLLFSLIMVIMLYSVVVFRRKAGDEEDGQHIHGNTALEIGWTIIPTFIVIGFGVWGAFTLNEITSVPSRAMDVAVTGRQWVWSFEYPEEGKFQSSELVLPVNQPINLQLNSVDVLHSFWVPEFRVKQDLVPGRTTTLLVTPTKEGDYFVRCAEICGTNHAGMQASVRVVSQEEYDAWIAEKMAAPKYAELTPEERGAIWHSAEGFSCVGCHSLDGSRLVGPSWLGLYGREETPADGTTVSVDEEYIRQSILNPNAIIVSGFPPDVMPKTYEDLFAEKEAEILANEGIEIDIVDDLIAFIKTLEE